VNGRRREITIGRVLTWTVALVVSAAALSYALLSLFGGHDGEAALYAVGGLCLALWAGADVTARPADAAR